MPKMQRAFRGLWLAATALVLWGVGLMLPMLEVLLGLQQRSIVPFSVFLVLSAGALGLVAFVLSLAHREGAVALVLSAFSVFPLPAIMMAIILIPVFETGARDQQQLCMKRMSDLSKATLLYVQDHDGRFPPADNWCDITRPYTLSDKVYRCPAARHLRSGYAMNSALSGVSQTGVAEPWQTILLFDSGTGWNAAGGQSLVAERHRGGANYSFADGHVQWHPDSGSLKWSVRVAP